MEEKKTRSVAKTFTWRVIATTTTAVVVYALTRELALSITAGGIEMVAKLILYYLHERTWNHISWGKEKC